MVIYSFTLPKMYESYGTLKIKTRAPQVFGENLLVDEDSSDLEQMKTVEQGMLSSTVLLRVAEKNDLASDPYFINNGVAPLALLGTLSQRVSVDLRKGSRLLDIRVEDTNPERAAQMVADIFKEYEIWEDGKQSELIHKTTEQLVVEEGRRRSKKDASEQRLQDFRAAHPVLGLAGQATVRENELESLNKELSVATNERLVLEAQFHGLAGQAEGQAGVNLAARGKRSQLALSLESQIALKEAEFAVVKERYLYKHPAHIAISTELARLEASLAQVQKDAEKGLKDDLNVAKSREHELLAMANKSKAGALEDEALREEFSLLTREAEVNRSLHAKVALQLQETQIGAVFDASVLAWTDEPLVAVDPFSPNKRVYLLMGAFLGAIIGLVLVLILTISDPRVHEGSAIERKLRLPMLAKLPAYSRGVVSDLSIGGESIEMLNRPAHLARYTTAALDGKERMQTLLFASPFDGDGKTLCVMKCARTMVKQGYRTLVIDADFRDQGLSRDYSGERTRRHGLAAYLMGEAEAAEVLFETGLPGMWFLPTGAMSGDSGDLLSGPGLRQLLGAIEPMFDRVVFDMSSVLKSDDVQAVARHLGATYLVAQKGKGKYKDLVEAKEILQSAGGNLTGFIWNEGGRRVRRNDLGPVIESVRYPAEVREVSPKGENEPMPVPTASQAV